MERDFKGVWIAREIWLDERMNALEKMILAEIDSLDGENGCFASNQYIAEFCQCSLTKVSTAISKLIDLGYIYTESFDGRTRILKSRLSKNERQTFKNCEADIQDLKDNNKDYQEKGLSLSPISPNGGEAAKNARHALFEQFWEQYPIKVDKKGAERVFGRIKGIDELMPTILSALERQKRSEQWTKDGGQFIPHPKTWLNQERWNYKIETPQNGSFDTDEFFEAALKRSMKK